MADHLVRIAESIKAEEVKIEFVALAVRCSALAQQVESWLEQDLEGQVYWLEVAGLQKPRVTLASAPIDIGPILRKHLYDKVPTVVLTSATLSAGGTIILVDNLLEAPLAPALSEVTLVSTVPSAMTELLRMMALPPSIKVVALAGEPSLP